LTRVPQSAVGICRPRLSTTLPQYLVAFSLDTTGRSRHNPRHQACLRWVFCGASTPRNFAGRNRAFFTDCPGRQGKLKGFQVLAAVGRTLIHLSFAASGERKCNTCPASRCSASIRCAKPAVTGFVLMPRLLLEAKAAAPAAANSCATFRRPSARASECVPAPSPRVRPSVPAPASSLWATQERAL